MAAAIELRSSGVATRAPRPPCCVGFRRNSIHSCSELLKAGARPNSLFFGPVLVLAKSLQIC